MLGVAVLSALYRGAASSHAAAEHLRCGVARFLVPVFFAVVSIATPAEGQVTANALQRVFYIEFGEVRASSFVIEVTGRQYLITARHVVLTIKDGDEIKLNLENEWRPYRVKRIPVEPFEADVAVLALPSVLGALLPTVVSLDGLFLSEQVYFLGFPYGLSLPGVLRHDGAPFPFVKHGIVASMGAAGAVRRLYLDGHNNPGFSGGPIVRRGANGETQIVGVVSGYRPEDEKIVQEGKDTGLRYSSNTGIVIGFSIEYALKAIAKRPIGAELSEERKPGP
jgi:S1-C subfamily serine protease